MRWRGEDAVHIGATEYLHPKTEESTGEIEIEPEVAAIFERFHDQAIENFVVESERLPIEAATYSAYRCKKTFDGLVGWLKSQGITAEKPLHELRKKFGSAIANEHGIFAAYRALRHADIAITTRHYADKKRRVTVRFGSVFNKGARP